MILPDQQLVLKQIALESLVTLISSLLHWVQKVQEDESRKNETDKLLDDETSITNSHEGRSPPSLKTTTGDVSENPVPLSSTNGTLSTFHELPEIVNSAGVQPNSQTSTGAVPLTQHEMIVKQRQRKLLFQEGISKFNQNPEKGLEFLIKHNYVEVSLLLRSVFQSK